MTTDYQTNRAALRAMTQAKYAAKKTAFLKDARSGKKPASEGYTEDQRRALIDADIAAIAAGGPKFGAPATGATSNTSSTARKPAPDTRGTPTNAREMTSAQYDAARAAFIRGD